MIKTFISHNSADDNFVDWVSNKLKRDFDRLDIFVDHWKNRTGDSAQYMIEEAKKSFFFIPILSNEYLKSEFCTNERKTAIKNKNMIEFPILLKIDKNRIPKDLLIDFKSHDEVSGRLWCDFSNEQEWETTYESLAKSILDKIASLNLLVRKEFYQDCDHLDLILRREIPTSSEIKIVFNIYLERDEFKNYFFFHLDKPVWLKYLKIYGYLNSNPEPIKAIDSPGFLIPYWPVLRYLEKISVKLIDEKEDEVNVEYLDFLIEIIQEVTEKNVDNCRTWWSFIKILTTIPKEKIPYEIIDLIPIWLDSKFDTTLQGTEIVTRLLPKFLDEASTDDDVRKAEKIIKYITNIKTNKVSKKDEELFGKKEKYSFKLDRYWIERALEKNIELVTQKCSLNVVKDIVNKIENMLANREDGTYSSFYKDARSDEPIYILTNALKNVLEKKAREKPEEIKDLLEEFIKHDFYYFQKMAIYVIGQNVEKYQELIWKYLKDIIGDSVLRNHLVGDELKHLMQSMREFPPEQKQKLKSIIEKGPTKDIPEEGAEKYKLRWKQELCHALRHEPTFSQFYEELKEQTQEEAELLPGLVWAEMKWGAEESPLSEEELIKKSNVELAKIFKEFRGENRWEGPTVDGLSDMLKKIVRENPARLIEDLNPFLNSGYLYIYDILWGIRDAWKDKKEIDWEKILDFIHKYIDRKDFWDDKFTVEGSHWSADHNWVLRFVGELIQEGTKDDSWAFKAELLLKAQEILILVIKKLLKKQIKKEKESDDPVTLALNSAPGNIITALILLALRKARVENKEIKKGESRWTDEIRDIYDAMLQNNVDEAFTLLGQYMPNFMYLDKAWVIAKIGELEKQKDPYWSYFMSGYFYGRKVFFDVFKLMMPYYIRAIRSEFKDKTAEERFIQHIAIGYLNDLVEIKKESLLDKLIEKSNPKQIDILVSYFRNQWRGLLDAKEKLDETTKIRNTVINFWRHLYQKYKEKPELSDDDREILSQLLDLTILLPKLDEENYKWIVFSLSESKHKRFYEPIHLIEDLKALKEKGDQPEAGRLVGKIFLEILKKYIPFTFKDNIKEIVEFLYTQDDAEIKAYAKEICNIYAEKGVYDEKTGQLFLRDVYEQHNQ